MSAPVGEVVKATLLAIEAHEYDDEFKPDMDGYAGYSNDAKGALWNATCFWSAKDREQFVAAFAGKHQHRTVAEVVWTEVPA